jgi:hypothetical protein
MNQTRLLKLLAGLLSLGPVLFVYLHPMGRQEQLSFLHVATPQAIAVSLWAMASSALYVYASREAAATKSMGHGCLGGIIVIVASVITIVVGVVPESWSQIESERFLQNLLNVVLLPCVVVFLAGIWKTRSSGS